MRKLENIKKRCPVSFRKDLCHLLLRLMAAEKILETYLKQGDSGPRDYFTKYEKEDSHDEA